MKDLTIIFLTVNKVPLKWAEYQKQILLEAVGDTHIITISKKPLDWGTNIIQTELECLSNLYWQMLKGAKVAKTPYIAIAEDDALYHKEHFKFRPPLNSFAYNMNRCGLFTWGVPTYFWKGRVTSSVMIAPRELTIEAIEEKFKKYPNGIPNGIAGEMGRHNVEEKQGVTLRNLVEFRTTISVVDFNHDFSIDPTQRSHRKRMGMIRAYDIPHWGRAEKLVKYFI